MRFVGNIKSPHYSGNLAQKFPDITFCDDMANPGEEMICGQCGQTILGKAMKVTFILHLICAFVQILTSTHLYALRSHFAMFPNNDAVKIDTRSDL